MPGTRGSQCSRWKEEAHTSRLPGSSASLFIQQMDWASGCTQARRWDNSPGRPDTPTLQSAYVAMPVGTHSCCITGQGTRSSRRTGRGTQRRIWEGRFGSFRRPVALLRLDVVQYFHLIFLLATARQPGPASRPFTESPKLLSAPLSVFLPSGQQEVSRGGAHSDPT